MCRYYIMSFESVKAGSTKNDKEAGRRKKKEIEKTGRQSKRECYNKSVTCSRVLFFRRNR